MGKSRGASKLGTSLDEPVATVCRQRPRHSATLTRPPQPSRDNQVASACSLQTTHPPQLCQACLSFHNAASVSQSTSHGRKLTQATHQSQVIKYSEVQRATLKLWSRP